MSSTTNIPIVLIPHQQQLHPNPNHRNTYITPPHSPRLPQPNLNHHLLPLSYNHGGLKILYHDQPPFTTLPPPYPSPPQRHQNSPPYSQHSTPPLTTQPLTLLQHNVTKTMYSTSKPATLPSTALPYLSHSLHHSLPPSSPPLPPSSSH